jgi:hypothetical protein
LQMGTREGHARKDPFRLALDCHALRRRPISEWKLDNSNAISVGKAGLLHC